MEEINRMQSLKKLSKYLSVLYVENDKDIREKTQNFLSKYFIHIDTAVNGKDGLELCKKYFIDSKKYYDIIISDIHMPELNGIDMCKAIKEINQTQKIIILSDDKDKNYLLDMLEIGVDSFIQKPLDAYKIVEILHKICITFHSDDIEYFKALTEASIVVKINIDGIITYVNEKLCHTTGYTKEELIGKPQSILNHPDDPKSLFNMIKDESIPNIVTSKFISKQKLDGSKFISESTIIPLFNQNGNIKEYMIIKNDITEIVKQKHNSFEKKQEQITSLLDAVLNNSTDVINNVDNIQELLKLTANKQKYSQELFSANKLIDNLIKKYYSFLESNHVELTFQAEEEFYIYCDKYRVEQIMSNILSNAIKYRKDKIIISLSNAEDKTKISIEDNSTFNLYSENYEELSNKQEQGAGIDLHFVKLLCNDLNINYDVQDATKLNGSNFIFTFNKDEISRFLKN